MDSTYEEAARCAKCGVQGRISASSLRAPRDAGGGMVHIFTCETLGCKWFDTTWVVQTRADGTIPNRETDRPDRTKLYPAISPDQEAAARRHIEQTLIDEQKGMTN